MEAHNEGALAMIRARDTGIYSLKHLLLDVDVLQYVPATLLTSSPYTAYETFLPLEKWQMLYPTSSLTLPHSYTSISVKSPAMFDDA